MWTLFVDVCVISTLIYILLGQTECLALQYTLISRDILNIMFLIFLFYISIPLIHCTTFDVCGYIKYMWFFPFGYTKSTSSSYRVQCDDKWGDAWLNLVVHLLEDIFPCKKEYLEDKYDNMGHLALETHEYLASYVPDQRHEIENHACVVDPGVTKKESWVVLNCHDGNHYFNPELGILGHPLDIKTTLQFHISNHYGSLSQCNLLTAHNLSMYLSI